MRKAILYCSLGLLSVSWLPGCSFFRSDREKSYADGGRFAPTRAGKNSSAAVDFGPIDTVNSGRTPATLAGIRPGLTTTTRPPAAQESPLKNAASTPIAPLPGALPKSGRMVAGPPTIDKVPAVGGNASPKKIELPDIKLPPLTVPATRTEEVPIVPPLEKPPVDVSPARSVGLPPVERAPAVTDRPVKKLVAEIPKIADKPGTAKRIQTLHGVSDGFKTVTGQVHVYRKTWRLRYAGIDQTDAYGGVLLLEGETELLSRLRDGQHVRVRGTLVPPTDRNGSASYRVTAIEMLD